MRQPPRGAVQQFFRSCHRLLGYSAASLRSDADMIDFYANALADLVTTRGLLSKVGVGLLGLTMNFTGFTADAITIGNELRDQITSDREAIELCADDLRDRLVRDMAGEVVKAHFENGPRTYGRIQSAGLLMDVEAYINDNGLLGDGVLLSWSYNAQGAVGGIGLRGSGPDGALQMTIPGPLPDELLSELKGDAGD